MAHIKVSEQSVLIISMLDTGEMGRCRAKWQGWNIFETTRFVWSAVVITYWQWSEQRKTGTSSTREGYEGCAVWSELTGSCGAENLNDGMCHNTVHLLYMGLHTHKLVRVSMLVTWVSIDIYHVEPLSVVFTYYQAGKCWGCMQPERSILWRPYSWKGVLSKLVIYQAWNHVLRLIVFCPFYVIWLHSV